MLLPERAAKILNLLERAGFCAYVVGGFVRDSLLGRLPGDLDVCTDAEPERVSALFSHHGYKVIPTGLKHGTVTVLTGLIGTEVTTFRVDGSYSDSRRPDSVRFTDDVVKDLSRRDFTVNAMAYSPLRGFVDPFGGRVDIENKLIRAVGNPDARFEEDALRMLRAIRFSALPGFSIERDTRESIHSRSGGLRAVSKERVAAELRGTLLSERPEVLAEMRSLGLLEFVLPGLEPAFDSGTAAEAVKAAGLLPPAFELRLAALFAVCSVSPEGEMRRLRFSNDEIRRVSELSALAVTRIEPDAAAVRLFLGTLKKIDFDEYEAVRRAVLEAGGDGSGLDELDRCRVLYDAVKERNEPYLISHLAIDGDDVRALGYSGEDIGRALKACLAYAAQDPSRNSPGILMAYVRDL